MAALKNWGLNYPINLADDGLYIPGRLFRGGYCYTHAFGHPEHRYRILELRHQDEFGQETLGQWYIRVEPVGGAKDIPGGSGGWSTACAFFPMPEDYDPHFPERCPRCKGPAYIGAINVIDCKWKCRPW